LREASERWWLPRIARNVRAIRVWWGHLMPRAFSADLQLRRLILQNTTSPGSRRSTR
jgi:hypothetical protein